ncbi:YqcI/YcgG family protein [Kribbella sp. NPDC003505]|uniref:YqcI/YcgG family protein n=1 Tax=Kribbella sp. NPDC003505 TaxID=3154448 RepID=UPI0033A4A7FC
MTSADTSWLPWDRIAQLPAADRRRTLVAQFCETISAPGFPCFFARQALTSEQIVFAYAAGSSDHVLNDCTLALRRLAARIRHAPELTGVLLVDVDDCRTIDEDEAFAGKLLRHLIAASATRWPSDAPRDPSDPHWTLWIDGVGFFLNISTPRHTRRRSRNVGDAIAVIAQARATFDAPAPSDPRVRGNIRRRIREYDSVPVHGALGRYGSPGTREIDQYFLGDGDSCAGSRAAHAESESAQR